MKTPSPRALLALLALPVLAPALPAEPAGPAPRPPLLLEVAGRPVSAAPFAVVAGQDVTLRLLPADASPADATPARLVQFAGALARPLDTPVSLEADPADPRFRLARFTPPAVKRPAAFGLRLGDGAPLTFTVFPADARRPDRASLADALETSRLRLLVCGPSRELRAWLRAEKLDFEDEGKDPPERLPADALLLGTLSEDDWKRLAAPRPAGAPPAGRLLAFVDAPELLPGVYAEPAARRAKITLPLLPALPADPLARETLHALLLQALTPPALEQ